MARKLSGIADNADELIVQVQGDLKQISAGDWHTALEFERYYRHGQPATDCGDPEPGEMHLSRYSRPGSTGSPRRSRTLAMMPMKL